MEFEGLICPQCASPLVEKRLAVKLECPSCGEKLKKKKFIALLEFLMEQGIVENIDFFDQHLYGDEIKKVEKSELEEETDPDEFEDKAERFGRYDDNVDLREVTTDENAFRDWDGLEEDWEEFNQRKEDRKTGANHG